MKKISIALTLGGALALTGCSSPEDENTQRSVNQATQACQTRDGLATLTPFGENANGDPRKYAVAYTCKDGTGGVSITGEVPAQED